MYFNPRSREGSDGLQTVAFAVRRRISIHAPAKGATKSRMSTYIAKLFQSTLPRRERRTSGCLIPRLYHFNPRSREGSDVACRCSLQISPIFQSTLPRRERRCFERFGCHAGNFNPRSREGSDSTPPDDVSMCLKFQSTLP